LWHDRAWALIFVSSFSSASSRRVHCARVFPLCRVLHQKCFHRGPALGHLFPDPLQDPVDSLSSRSQLWPDFFFCPSAQPSLGISSLMLLWSDCWIHPGLNLLFCAYSVCSVFPFEARSRSRESAAAAFVSRCVPLLELFCRSLHPVTSGQGLHCPFPSLPADFTLPIFSLHRWSGI
jgi:hypothetical protein